MDENIQAPIVVRRQGSYPGRKKNRVDDGDIRVGRLSRSLDPLSSVMNGSPVYTVSIYLSLIS